MSMTSDRNDQGDVERLLAIAGPRDAVPAERLERIRAAVYEAWKGTPRTRARSASGERPEDKPRGWGPSELKKDRRRLAWTLVTAAAGAAIVITVLRTPPDATIAKPAEVPVVAAAIHITTGPAERKSLPLSGGGELRVDVASVVTIAENGEIHISRGALYLDSKGTALPAVITPAGRITDIGTRFEVRLIGEQTRVRVRDGKVRLSQAGTVTEVIAAEELLARPDSSPSLSHMAPFGGDWAWVTRAAPRFDVEGQSLQSFLDWIETEGAWTIAFASPALERSARWTVVHGSIDGMSTTEALETILLACGLTHRVDLKTGRVTITAEGSR